MKSILKATAVLGGASVVNILIGLVSSKITALLLGPSGFGLMSLYQSLIGLTIMAAGLGLPTALTRTMAGSLAENDRIRTAALRRAGWAVTLATAILAVGLLLIFSAQVETYLLSARHDLSWTLFILPAIVFSMVSAMQIAVINARHQVADLAKISILTAVLSLLPTILLVWHYREAGVAPAIAANTFISMVVSYHYYRMSFGDEQIDVPSSSSVVVSELVDAGRELIGFGLPFVASLVVGAGVLTIIPLLVLHALGEAAVGLFRAGSALAVNYLSVILASMAQDYFPRVSKASDDPAELSKIVNDQLHLVFLLAGPVILAMIGLVPYLVPLLYSSDFMAAAEMLEWQLIGDIFKFATWAMGFVIMVKLGSKTFFLTELSSGMVLLAASWFGMRLWGLSGLGIGFFVTGVFACAINWLVLYRSRGITWRRDNVVLFMMLIAAAVLLRAIAMAGVATLNLLVAAVLSGGFGLYSLLAISREFGGWRILLTKRQQVSDP